MIRVRQIKIPIEKDNKETIKKELSKKLKINGKEIIDYSINKKSIDARKDIFYIYEIDVKVEKEEKIKYSKDILKTPKEEYKYPIKGKISLKNRIIIVGSGPCGLFAGYLLSEMGYHPLIIEQGERIEDRVKTVEHFFKTNELKENSNIQFGEGGAGTFSDGKLNTLVKDKDFRGKKVFEIFVENGAPKEILYEKNPHIGTDYLRIVIKNMREKIISMGGEFLFNSKMTDIILENGKVKEIEINKERKIPCDVLLLAIGHSSRDTFYLLKDKGVLMKNKNFAIGVRVEHPQEMINKNQYKEKYHLLPPASYKLTYQTKDNRGVYSFCMCPGGFVVNASSENNRLTINGMSNYKRDEKNANSAIVVSITEKDYGNNLLDGVKYQRELEEKAYRIGEGKIPIQLLEDFYKNEKTKELKEITPNTKGSYQFANLNDCLPKEICDAIKEAFFDFSKKIKGFNRGDCILSAIEARTSSPIRILRDEYFESNIKGIYPSGEGAGYAGGITTSAMDGFKVAESIIKRYN